LRPKGRELIDIANYEEVTIRTGAPAFIGSRLCYAASGLDDVFPSASH
jgi:hypothetical protein